MAFWEVAMHKQVIQPMQFIKILKQIVMHYNRMNDLLHPVNRQCRLAKETPVWHLLPQTRTAKQYQTQ